MKVLILGAAGEVGIMLTNLLLKETNDDLVLFARHASLRIKIKDESREQLVDGDFTDKAKLIKAMKEVDAVYINDMGTPEAVKNIIEAMQESGVKRFIGATILGIYNEVEGEFGKWNDQMIGHSPRYEDQRNSVAMIENSVLDYTLLRLTWLYNQEGNEKYHLTQKGEPFIGAQVTRQAVARLIVDILNNKTGKYTHKSLGVSEPGTEKMSKPSFY